MAVLRNVSSDAVRLVVGGREFGEVPPDGRVEVPDELFRAHAWPEQVWSVVRKSEKEKA